MNESAITGLSSSVAQPTAPAGSNDNSSLQPLQKAKERITFLETENNALRRRLGMPELPPSDIGMNAAGSMGHLQAGTPQRHTPSKFAIVGGGNSEDAIRLRKLASSEGSGSGAEGSAVAKGTLTQLLEVKSSHEKLASLMVDIDRVTSRFFTFEIEEEELKDGVQKLLKSFKREKKGYAELYGRIERHNSEVSVKASPEQIGLREREKHSPSKSHPLPNMNGPPATFKKENSSPFGSSSPERTSVFGNSSLPGPNDNISSTASSVGVAYRIRERGRLSNNGPSTLSPKRSSKHSRAPPPLNNSIDGTAGWIQNDDVDDEAKLRKELKAAKARMKKQMEMQEWLEKKEEKALKALEEEENVRKKMQVSKGCLIKKIRDGAGQMHLT